MRAEINKQDQAILILKSGEFLEIEPKFDGIFWIFSKKFFPMSQTNIDSRIGVKALYRPYNKGSWALEPGKF